MAVKLNRDGSKGHADRISNVYSSNTSNGYLIRAAIRNLLLGICSSYLSFPIMMKH